MDWSALFEGCGMVAGLAGAVISLWVRSIVDKKVAKAVNTLREEEIAPMQKRLDAQHDIIVKLSSRCDGLATREDVHSIALALSNMTGEMKVLGARVEAGKEREAATAAAVRRVDEYLFQQANK